MKIHFIGIGGIGLSALARFLNNSGHSVSGSDIAPTTITEQLSTENITITILTSYTRRIFEWYTIYHNKWQRST